MGIWCFDKLPFNTGQWAMALFSGIWREYIRGYLDDDSGWVLPGYNISQQLGGRATTPFITPSGESLFFAGTPDFGGYGHQDIWLAKRLMLGDLNLDSQHTSADVVLELNKVFLDEPFPAALQIGDSNCDNLFTPADVVLLLNRVFMGAPFPC